MYDMIINKIFLYRGFLLVKKSGPKNCMIIQSYAYIEDDYIEV